ncbi:hypothetical protein F5Y18DRAFT_428567 [Xylariaceae sp. FL1019]|nr:hypothetical protein F5Y18DRAFT_428567 [Xylariaceae sp. FL1019]
MSGNDDKTKDVLGKVSDGDIKFFTTFFTFVPQTIPGFDWDGFAKGMGMKNANVAKVRYGQIRKKLGITGAPSESSDSVHTTTAGPNTPTKVTKAVKTPRKTPSNAVAKRRNLLSSMDATTGVDRAQPAYDDDEGDEM